MTCGQMTYDYRHKIGRVPGQLTVHQKDRILTADSGIYDAKAETITLVGNVHGHNGDNEIQAPKVIFYIKEGDETITIPAPTHGPFPVSNRTKKRRTILPRRPPSQRFPAPTSSPSTAPMTPNSAPPVIPPPADNPPAPAAKS